MNLWEILTIGTLVIGVSAVAQTNTNLLATTNTVARTNLVQPRPVVIPQSLRSLLAISNRLHTLEEQSMQAQMEFTRTHQHLNLQLKAKAISEAQHRRSFHAAQDKWLARYKAIDAESSKLRLREFELRKLHPLPGNTKKKRNTR